MMRKYRVGDEKKIAVQSEQKAEADTFAAEFNKIFAYSLCDAEDTVVYAVCGWKKGELPSSAECFALVGQNIGRKLLELVRFAHLEIRQKAKKHRVKILFMTVRKNFYPASRLARLLGFWPVCDLDNFFNNNDYQLFERKIP